MTILRVGGISNGLCSYIKKMEATCIECNLLKKNNDKKFCKTSVTDQQLTDILTHLQKVDGNAHLCYNQRNVILGNVEGIGDVAKDSSSFIIDLSIVA